MLIKRRVALVVLGSSGWIGGKITFEHKIGVVENADLEATEIGKRGTGQRIIETAPSRWIGDSVAKSNRFLDPTSRKDLSRYADESRARFRDRDKLSYCSFSEVRSLPK